MKVFFDQNMPRPLRKALAGHLVMTAAQMGWDRLRNGQLLQAAEDADFDVFVTADQNLQHQQDFSTRLMAILVLTRNNWPDVAPRAQEIAAAVNAATPGSFTVVRCTP